MKAIQKFEIFTGFATFVAMLLKFFVIAVPNVSWMEKSDNSNDAFLAYFLFGFLPAFLISIGAFMHALKQSAVGLILIIFFGGIILYLIGVPFLVGYVFGGHLFIGISPALFACITILLASYSQIISDNQAEEAKFS